MEEQYAVLYLFLNSEAVYLKAVLIMYNKI